MQTAPDIAGIAALIGDRARAAMLISLLGGRALTATELSRAASVTKQTASSHLSRLVEARLLTVESQGRHRYFRLAGSEVGDLLERLMGLAGRVGAVRVETGPADPLIRKARVCYDHLAGELGVLAFDSLKRRGLLRVRGPELEITSSGERFFEEWSVDVGALRAGRRPLCRACLDWSVRRHHLAGALGAAVLGRCLSLGWASRARNSRALIFSATGERAFRSRFPLP